MTITPTTTAPDCGRIYTGLAAALLLVTGCITPWERKALLDDRRAEIGSVQGPTERRVKGWFKQRKLDEDDPDVLSKPIAGIEEYRSAEKLYEQQDYPAAEKAFKKVAKEFKKSEIREDALFMEAEAAFAQDRLARAHDLYAMLLKDYPTTRHLDAISNRNFKIAMIWLGHPQVAEQDDIQQVNHEDYREKLPAPAGKPPKRNILVPNFTDRTKPIFDPQGNALVALRSIWVNDPAGPLADDALMLTASYHARVGDFVEADRHFTMLREQFPNSPHVQKAFELGSHVKLMSYQGSPYDDKTLTDAEQLKLATLRLYPELETRDRMQAELKRIEEAKADRLWTMVVFYEGKGKKKAAATYAHMLISQHPESKYAAQAKAKLEQFGPGYADGRALQSPYPDPPQTLWNAIFPPNDNGGIPTRPVQQTPATKDPGYARRKPKSTDGDEAPEPVRQTGNVPVSTSPSPKPTVNDATPRQLPDDADVDAKPASSGRVRLGGDDNEDSGHTQLN